ncbi:MAG: hypothetical protein IPO54_10625 [Micavibrio sp.]|nr:hypothetical protein [Micavibrio sp.]
MQRTTSSSARRNFADIVGTDDDARMFADKSKSAFRAGKAWGTEWDDVNVGSYSAAFGESSIASGNRSFAAGESSVASGPVSTALNSSTASADYAFASGINTVASGDFSHAGGGNTTASGAFSTALGREAIAGSGTASDGTTPGTGLGDHSMAIGLGDASTATYPRVTGDSSLGIFMGDQQGVNITASNLMALLGGRFVLDPDATSAANTNVSTGVQQLELDVQGDIGAVNFCDEAGNNCFTPASVATNRALSAITAATAGNSINNADYAQVWNWLLTTADKDAFTFTENTASTATGHSSILKAATLATSTATPLRVTNLGAADSFVVNDETGDADASPFVINAAGNVGIGTALPEAKLHVAGGDLFVIEDNGSGPRDLYVGEAATNWKIGLRVNSGNGDDSLSLFSNDGSINIVPSTGLHVRHTLSGTGDFIVNTDQFYVDTSTGNVGIGMTAPASRFVVASPTAEVIGAAATITANACGTVKQVSATANRTTNTTDTFTQPTASYNGCCMDVVNIDTVDTITLDQNAKFFTGPGTDLALGPGKAVRVCSDGTSWYQAASVTSVASGGNIPLSGLTAAIADNSINSGDWNQTWNWQLVGAETGLVVGENVASSGGTIGASGNQFIMKASTLATSTATPLVVTNLGTANSFRVNDATGDTDTTPFVVDEAGEVGIGTATPGVQLQIHQPTGAFPKMRLTAADVTTAVTSGSASVGDVSATNTIGQIRNRMDGGGVHTGGMLIQGFTGSGVNNHYPLHLMGMHGGTAPTTAAVTIGAQKWSGTNNRSALDGTTPILDIENNYSTAASGGLVMRIMGDGKVGIGTAAPGELLDILGTDAEARIQSNGEGIIRIINASGSANQNAEFVGRRARGTIAAPTIVQDDDPTLGLWGEAYDGNTWEVPALMQFMVDGTPGDEDMPGRIEFQTQPDGGGSSPESTTPEMVIKSNGAVGVGLADPASRFVVAAPATEVIGAAATITANACGTVKRLSATANRTTDTTDTFTTPTASYAGCCMDVVNVDTVDTITLDNNANFITGPGADLAVGPGKAVRVCSDGTSWYQASTVTSAAATILAIDDLSDAFTDYAVENNLIMGRAGAVALAAGAQRNTFIGQDAGATTADSTATTDSNTAVGYASLRSLTSGDQNTALGRNTLTNNLSGSYNVAVGNQALQQNTIGNGNTAVGSIALYSNVAKRESTAIGYGAMFYADDTAVSAVTYNTAVGAYALQGSATAANNTGTANTAIGHSALLGNTSGTNNTALGRDALSVNTQGYSNTAIGSATLVNNDLGQSNVAVGYGVLASNTGSHASTGVGAGALGISTGGRNTALGAAAGDGITTGTDNIVIGYDADTPANNSTYHLNIGGTIFGDLANDRVRIGGSGVVGAGPFIAAPPSTEVVAAAAVITANACGSIKQISATANRTTNTTDTFTQPTAAYAGCRMDVVNIDTVDTITPDQNANFFTGRHRPRARPQPGGARLL